MSLGASPGLISQAVHINARRERATSSPGSSRFPMPSFGKREKRKPWRRTVASHADVLRGSSSFVDRGAGTSVELLRTSA